MLIVGQATKDYKRTIAGVSQLGIGPWRVYTSNHENTTDQTYRGKPSAFTMRLCFAELSPEIVYEVIQPVSGPTVFQEFLDEHGEGIHHVAYDCNNLPMEERVKLFEQRGFAMAHGGNWMGKCRFAFFESEETGTCY